MASDLSDNEQNNHEFHYFLQLPQEVRMIIIDSMQRKDRFRFSALSKLCSREAKSSKKYLHGLKLSISISVLSIHVVHAIDRVNNHEQKIGFELLFEDEQNIKFMICKNLSGREIWRRTLDDSVDMIQFALEHFRNVLQFYQSSIKYLSVSIDHPMIEANEIDFGIAHLNNVEDLHIYYDVDIRQFLPKTRKQLKNLSVLFGRENREHLQTLLNNEIECRKIYKTEIMLRLHADLNYQQLIQISTPVVFMQLGQLTEEDISNFLKSWQQNAQQQWYHYHWTSTVAGNPVLNFQTLATLLGYPQHNFENDERLILPHSRIEGKNGGLYYRRPENYWAFDG